jgi:hypothetical protein
MSVVVHNFFVLLPYRHEFTIMQMLPDSIQINSTYVDLFYFNGVLRCHPVHELLIRL